MTFAHFFRSRYGRFLAGLIGMVFLLMPLASCAGPGTSTTQPTPTPTQSELAVFVPIDLGIPAEALNAPVVGNLPDSTQMHVNFVFKTNQQLLNQMNSKKVHTGQQQDLATVANQLGISDSTYAKIKAFFGITDASLTLSKLHTKMSVDAKAGTFAHLLQTQFVIHTLNGRQFFTPASDKKPKLPKFIADALVTITGLDNYSVAPDPGFITTPHRISHIRQHTAANCSVNSQLVTPAEVGHAYGYDQMWKEGWLGQGMTVNFLEMEGFDPNDIQNYFSCVNFKGSLHTVNVDNPPTTAGGEATLDIEMVAGLAPAINMVVYQADRSNVSTYGDFWTLYNDILTSIADNNSNSKNPNVISLSWSAPEERLTQGNLDAINSTLQVLIEAEHMTVFSSTGDCGAFSSRVYKHLSIRFPSSDPYSTAVGGTILGVDSQGNRRGEIAWSDGSDTSKCQNQWGTGGGLSIIFPRPNWQSGEGVNNSYSDSHRQTPDIAAVAYALPVYFGGQWLADGGTSASTPIWAAGMSLVNQGIIQKKSVYFYGTDTFYQAANTASNLHPYYDITRGNNLYYPATVGWDYTTGLGTPNLADFFVVLYNSVT